MIVAAEAVNTCSAEQMPMCIKAFINFFISTEDNEAARYKHNANELPKWKYGQAVINDAIARVGMNLDIEAAFRECYESGSEGKPLHYREDNRITWSVKNCIEGVYDHMMAYFIDNDRLDLYEYWNKREPIWGWHSETVRAVARSYDTYQIGCFARQLEEHETVKEYYTIIIGEVPDKLMRKEDHPSDIHLTLAIMAGRINVCKAISDRMFGHPRLEITIDAINDYPVAEKMSRFGINPSYCSLECLRYVINEKVMARYMDSTDGFTRSRLYEFMKLIIKSKRVDLIESFMTKEMTAWMLTMVDRK